LGKKDSKRAFKTLTIMANNDFPRDCKPLHVQSPDGASIRTRLIDIEHVSQPGTRNKNAVHIELFDQISIGRLKRVNHDELIDGDGGKYDIDMGIILCGRSPKNIKVFHSENSNPTCNKCIDIMNRLIAKGMSIYTVPRELWGKLQECYFQNEANMTLKKMNMDTPEKIKKKFEEFEELGLENIFKGFSK